MTYPFIEENDTIKFMQNSCVMVFLSGFGAKGDEQSSLSRKIINKYPKSSINLQFCSGVCKPLKKAISDHVQTIVIDHASDDVECMQQIYAVAHENNYIELALKAECKGTSSYRAIVPTFYGWFLNFDDSQKVRENVGQSVLRDSFSVKEFADDFRKQIDDPPKDLQDRFSTKELDVGGTMLHCTSMHYTRNGFEEYNERVGPSVGRVFQIEVLGFLITPRTFGARLKLDKNAEKFWQNGGADKPCGWEPSKFSPTSGKASRAHLTLGTAPGVPAFQTGEDLEDLVDLEVKAKHDNDIPTYEFQNATLRNYGKGQAMVYLNEPMHFPFLFSGYNLKK